MGLFSIPILGDVISSVKDLVSEAIPDPDKRREVELELTKIADAAEARLSDERISQMAVNQEEAKSGSVFVAGWRPFVGWVSGVGLAAQSIVLPILAHFTGNLIELDTTLLITTLTGMLGIGAMRTYEKVKGVSTNDYRDVPETKKKGAPVNLLKDLPEDAPW